MNFKSKFKSIFAFIFLYTSPSWALDNFNFSEIYLKSKEEVNKILFDRLHQIPQSYSKSITNSSEKNKSVEVVSYGKKIKITFAQNRATTLNIKCCDTWQDSFKLIGITEDLPSPEKFHFEDTEVFIWGNNNSIPYNGAKFSAVWGKSSKSLRITQSFR